MKILSKIIFLLGFLWFPSQTLAEIKVVASIQPIHSLVSMIMDGVGEPYLILDRTASPHRYSLSPKKAKQIEEADIIFWVGPYIETFLIKPINNLNKKNINIQISKLPNLTKYKTRSGDGFEEHDHDHGHHDDHDDHKAHKDHDDHDDHKAHKDHDDHDDHDDHKAHKDHDDHDDHKGHDEHSEEIDQHVWLDPENAKIILEEIKIALSKVDPSNRKIYEKNSLDAKKSIDILIEDTRKKLQNYGNNGFIYFHDAYQYFEKRFGLKASGSITVSTEVMPGAKRLKELKLLINKENIKCVFSEPQFESKIVKAVIEGTGKKAVVLDPLGYNIEPGKNLYNKLIVNMTESFLSCIK